MARFSASEWDRAIELLEADESVYGLPASRERSAVLGTFNILKLGSVRKRSSRAWTFLQRVTGRFDLLAIQEVLDELAGLEKLRSGLDSSYGLAVSDTTGATPGSRGLRERLAYLFRWPTIGRTEIASDISYDRTAVLEHLVEQMSTHPDEIKAMCDKASAIAAHNAMLAPGKKPKKLPKFKPPGFVTFMRQPYCAGFHLNGRNGAKPVDFLAVNAHLLYGDKKIERKQEFDALLKWLVYRAKMKRRTMHDNILLLGDLNLDFADNDVKRETIDDQIKDLNGRYLSSDRVTCNFPLLSAHPTRGMMKTAARSEETYDHIGIFARDATLPGPDANAEAGQLGEDGYDYGVFRFIDLFADALFGKKYNSLAKAQKDRVIEGCKAEVSDHMPVWMRLPIPGA
ncbi:MAG: endonuclease/exonuclease/phosphatase [Planctomycetota bacterium]